MPESKKTKLTGQVISTEIGSKESYSDYSSYHEKLYWIDIGLKLIEGHIINIYYSFERSSIRNNINNSIKKGMTVTVTVNEQVDIERKCDYQGVGSIQIQDLSNELDRFVRNQFRSTENDYFTNREKNTVYELLVKAREKIKETFNPTEEEMAKVEEHLDSLARKTESVTKYDWRRLFVSCVVSVSIDLGFGATIPETLYNLFKKLIEELIQYKLPAP